MNFQVETQEQVTGSLPIEATPEYISSQIVKLFNLLNNTGALMGKRESMVGIWKRLTNIQMPKAIGTELRQELEDLGFIGGANGSIPAFKDLEKYRGLVHYGIFTDTEFTVPELDETDMSSAELTMYKEACAMRPSLPKESLWEKRLNEFGLRIPSEYNDFNITKTGHPIQHLERKKLDIPEVTDYLPEDATLIQQNETAYIYVTTPCALKLTLKNIPLMPIDIVPIFYKTFHGGIPIEATGKNILEDTTVYPPCEDVHFSSYFGKNNGEKFLDIQSVDAYIYLVKRGVYQKYHQMTEQEGDKFFIMRSYILDGSDNPTASDVIEDLESGIFKHLDGIKDIATLEFMKKDLIDTVAVDVDEYITEIIDARILALS